MAILQKATAELSAPDIMSASQSCCSVGAAQKQAWLTLVWALMGESAVALDSHSSGISTNLSPAAPACLAPSAYIVALTQKIGLQPSNK